MAWHLTWQCGAGHVRHASIPKSPNIQQLSSNPSPSPSAASDVQVDLVGPLPASANSFIYIFTIIDCTTRWLEAIPLKEMTANTCTAAPKEFTGSSSAQLVLGQPLVLPGELKDVTEAAADNFSSQLASSDPPPTCQPCSYTDVAATLLQIPKQL